jgi:hypothetical protein
MMPGGHLATSLLLSGGAYAYTRSAPLAVGCVLGGFLIDFDHYLDYVVFERQWRRASPAYFLRYYFTYQLRKVVLPLHSLELMAALAATAVLWPQSVLIGYLLGATMHLVFDILINGSHVLKRRVLFYSFVYRALQGFSAEKLMDTITVPAGTGDHPYLEFFKWRPPEVTGECRGESKTEAVPESSTTEQ